MAGFESPNHTQTPNDLFDSMLPDMDLCELKVTLFAIRKTIGFHRGSFRMSLTDMEDATGLSRQGVLNGAEAAEKRGTMKRTQNGGVTVWGLVVKNLDQTSQSVRPPSIKETIKEKEHAPKARSVNPIFDALTEVTGMDAKAAGGYIGKTARDLRDYDAETIRRAYAPGGWWYTVHCSGMTTIPRPSLAGICKTIKQAAEYNTTDGAIRL